MMAGVDLGGHEDYSSPEQRSTDLLTWALRPWLYRIARAVSTLLPSTRGPSSTRAPWSGRPCSTATPRTRWDRGRLAAALRGPRAGGPPAHPGHRRPATTRSRCRLTVQTREFALELEVRAEGPDAGGTVVPTARRPVSGPRWSRSAGRARSPAPHPGDLPLLALPLVAVSPARWATPPGRTCATVSRASTSERATTPGLPFPRVVARTGPGALVQPGLRADGVPPRCSGDHTPIHRHTKERQRRHRRYGPAMACAAKAEQWKDDSRVEGHRRFVCASGGWRNPMALLVAARVVCRSGCRTIRRTRWSLGDSASFRQPCMRTKVPSRDWRTCTRAPTNRVGSIEAA
jgi:hypothetical protein